MAHTAQPIHKDTPVPSHAMPYTYTAAAYTRSSYQLATSVTLLRQVTNVVDIRKHTRQDPTLSSVLQCVKTAWATLLSNNVEPKSYYIRRSELGVQDDCIFWGSGVIVSPKLRKNILHELHEPHPGIVRMKAPARSYLWWRIIDIDIESVVKECNMCQQRHKSPLHPWEWPHEPWSRLHIYIYFILTMYTIYIY